MPEEGALGQVRGQVRAVDDHELSGRFAVLVDAAGEELLARARLAGDDDVGLAARGLAHGLQTGHDPGALADDGAALDLAPSAGALGGAVGHGPLQDEGDGADRDGFAHIVPGAVGDGQGRAVGVAVAREDDHLGQGSGGLELLDVRQTVAVGQVHVEEDEVAVRVGHEGQRFPDGMGHGAGVSHALDDALEGA
ncbi:hypothetical protein DSECCO2_629440 [anaerobic digester metagenome]